MGGQNQTRDRTWRGGCKPPLLGADSNRGETCTQLFAIRFEGVRQHSYYYRYRCSRQSLATSVESYMIRTTGPSPRPASHYVPWRRTTSAREQPIRKAHLNSRPCLLASIACR